MWTFFALMLSGILAWADPSTDLFREESQKLVSPVAELSADRGHAFCFAPEGSSSSAVQGENTDQLVRIASVSKLATSYWALKVLGPNFRFHTKIHYNSHQKALHIEGSGDPFFGRARIYLLLSELNRMGVFAVDQVSFDQRFKFFLEVESSKTSSLGLSGGVSPEATLKNLNVFLNTDKWETKEFYQKRIEIAKQEGVEMASDVTFNAPQIRLTDESPFSLNSGSVVSWSYASLPLYRLLKHTNVVSHNYIADELFNLLGGAKAFARFIQSDLGLGPSQIQMHTGSGLPSKAPAAAAGTRIDNEATCEAILVIMEAMSDLLQEVSSQDLEDVMLVAGVDRGTLEAYTEERFADSPLGQGAAAVKTGYIRNSINIAGQVRGEDGKTYFGIYLQLPNLEDPRFNTVLAPFKATAEMVRDRLFERFIRNWGGPNRYNYKAQREFFAVDQGSLFVEFDSTNLHNSDLYRQP